MAGFLCYDCEGLIPGGAYTWRGLIIFGILRYHFDRKGTQLYSSTFF